MINGSYSIIPLWMPLIDVRDLAKIHYLTLINPKANGRFNVPTY